MIDVVIVVYVDVIVFQRIVYRSRTAFEILSLSLILKITALKQRFTSIYHTYLKVDLVVRSLSRKCCFPFTFKCFDLSFHKL